MSHELEILKDGKAATFIVGQPAWHGLGTVLQNPPTIAEAIQAAGLDWKVGLRPVYVQDHAKAPETLIEGHRATSAISGYQATVRESDNKVLGIVGKQFVPLQNQIAFDWFQPFLDSKAVTLESAGSLKEGRRIWILAKLKESEGGVQEIVPGDTVEQYLLLAHAHDGSLAIRVGFCSVRVCCSNTLTAAIKDTKASKLLKIRHTAHAPVALGIVQEVIDTTRREFAANADVFRLLAATGCDEVTARQHIREIFEPGSGNNEEALPRLVNQVIELFHNGIGTQYSKDTLWALFNAITQYITHEQGRNAGTRLDSQWFGKGALIIRRALEILSALTGVVL